VGFKQPHATSSGSAPAAVRSALDQVLIPGLPAGQAVLQEMHSSSRAAAGSAASADPVLTIMYEDYLHPLSAPPAGSHSSLAPLPGLQGPSSSSSSAPPSSNAMPGHMPGEHSSSYPSYPPAENPSGAAVSSAPGQVSVPGPPAGQAVLPERGTAAAQQQLAAHQTLPSR
jgi:hypothetical protein